MLIASVHTELTRLAPDDVDDLIPVFEKLASAVEESGEHTARNPCERSRSAIFRTLAG
jgi:hypothetical protein